MTAVKEKNLAKELLSSSHQTAIKALGALVEVSGSICPMIDKLSRSHDLSPSQHASQNATGIQKYKPQPPSRHNSLEDLLGFLVDGNHTDFRHFSDFLVIKGCTSLSQCLFRITL
jgi:hypothetical protein